MPRWPKKDDVEINAELPGLTGSIESSIQTNTPAAIKILYPYAFIDEDGTKFAWESNKVFRNKYSIAMLVERNIAFEEVKDDEDDSSDRSRP